MTEGFEPKIQMPMEFYENRLRGILDRQCALEQCLYSIPSGKRTGKNKKKRKEAEQSLSELQQEKEIVLKEMEAMMESNRYHPTYTFPDEEIQLNNIFVGHCYGKAICVDDEGAIRYTEVQRGIYTIGDTVIDDGTLHYLEDLPKGEQDMILRYLCGCPDTPEFFLKREEE